MIRAQLESFFVAQWQRISPWQLLLRPLSWLFGAVASLRRTLYRRGLLKAQRIDVPVIVVGNISVGGTGKTPLVIALCQHLKQKGYRPGVVSRGYHLKPAPAQRRWVPWGSGNKPADIMSDEAELIANRAGVAVSVDASRVQAARNLLTDDPTINVIISDDGLQHYALYRDMEIAVIDGSRGFGNGALLPAGPLREPVSRLFKVDAVVVNGQGRRLPKNMPTLYATTLGRERFISLETGTELSIEAFRDRAQGKRLHMLAGIGNPARFFSHLSRLGLVGISHSFPDHHPFGRDDLNLQDADLLLMTEKDAVKCLAFADARCWFMRVDALLPEALLNQVLARLASLQTKRKKI